MEMGFEFLAGAIAGVIVATIIAAIIAAGKNSMRKKIAAAAAGGKRPETDTPGAASAPSAIQDGKPPRNTNRRGPDPRNAPEPGGNTVIVEQMESQTKTLNNNIQEVRNLLLKLADVVSHTENASGKAAVAFNSARDVIHRLDSEQHTDLAEAQAILIAEIDKVLTTNATLHSELDMANKGIAEQRRQIEELRTQARIDGLTRIANRVAFDERLAEYIGLLERTTLTFTLLLLDVDFFKRVNDEFGHVNGDRILRGIAAKITDSIRSNDIAARYGGEEFAVILPGTDLQEAKTVAERVRQDIAKTIFRMDNENLKITVSGGLAQCRRGMTPEQLVDAADQSLYHAKNSGRNTIHAAES